jgi:hypothetical protein
MTNDELERIERLAAATLPGPWQSFVEGRDHWGGDDFIRTGGMDNTSPDMYVTLSYSDHERPKPADHAVLDFIAAARQEIPRLVAEVRRLRAQSA